MNHRLAEFYQHPIQKFLIYLLEINFIRKKKIGYEDIMKLKIDDEKLMSPKRQIKFSSPEYKSDSKIQRGRSPQIKQNFENSIPSCNYFKTNKFCTNIKLYNRLI